VVVKDIKWLLVGYLVGRATSQLEVKFAKNKAWTDGVLHGIKSERARAEHTFRAIVDEVAVKWGVLHGTRLQQKIGLLVLDRLGRDKR
jgi:hypothetical protein